jgi:hypothetical protein
VPAVDLPDQRPGDVPEGGVGEGGMADHQGDGPPERGLGREAGDEAQVLRVVRLDALLDHCPGPQLRCRSIGDSRRRSL